MDVLAKSLEESKKRRGAASSEMEGSETERPARGGRRKKTAA
jgi:hypothetical protein